MKTLTDTDPMPFGIHKGKPMSCVPASYFHWLWSQKGFKDDPTNEMANYIRKNVNALKMEYKDGIW